MEEEVEREIFMHISFHHSHHSVNERNVECFVVTQSTIYEIYLFIFLQMNTKTRHGRERAFNAVAVLQPQSTNVEMKKMREKVFFCVCTLFIPLMYNKKKKDVFWINIRFTTCCHHQSKNCLTTFIASPFVCVIGKALKNVIAENN